MVPGGSPEGTSPNEQWLIYEIFRNVSLRHFHRAAVNQAKVSSEVICGRQLSFLLAQKCHLQEDLHLHKNMSSLHVCLHKTLHIYREKERERFWMLAV